MAEPRTIDLAELRLRLERTFDFAAQQVRATVERTPDYFPIYTVNGRWQHRGELWTDWCAGFHAGMMWRIALRTGDPWWRATAERYSKLLEHKQHDRVMHPLQSDRVWVPENRLHPSDVVLSNGIRLIVQTERTSPTVTLVGSIKTQVEMQTPPGNDGVSDVLEGLLESGAALGIVELDDEILLVSQRAVGRHRGDLDGAAEVRGDEGGGAHSPQFGDGWARWFGRGAGGANAAGADRDVDLAR